MRRIRLRFFLFTRMLTAMLLVAILGAAVNPVLLQELGTRQDSLWTSSQHGPAQSDSNLHRSFQRTENPGSDGSDNLLGSTSFGWNPLGEKIKDFAGSTNAEGSIELVIGLNDAKTGAYEGLVDLTNRNQGETVNEISIGGRVTALVVVLPSAGFSSFARQVQDSDLARYIEPNAKFQIQFIPNDPRWTMQWGPQKIEADRAWDTTTGSHSVLVAVIDTGVDYNHPDLASNYASGGLDWVNNDTDPMDDNGHGTHCAGIIGAVINNGIGIAGIAQVSIMAEKALDADGQGDEVNLAKAIIHAVDHGARILSNSWGSYVSSVLIHDAIRYAYGKGVLIVAAAGNDASIVRTYPAAYDEVIAVTATDRFDNPADFTSFGDWVELAAPGVDVYSTYPDNSYGLSSGTSMACPHVVGLAALIWSRFPNETRDWVRVRLRFAADDLGFSGFDEHYGYGRINARKAIEETWPYHDVLISNYEMPKYVHFGNTVSFNATVLNFGRSKEENVIVELFVNDRFENVTGITSLALGGTETVSLSWNPSQKGTYNVTLRVQPVMGQNSTEHDAVTQSVHVMAVRGNVVFEEAHLPLYTVGNNPAGGVPGGYSDFADYLAANGYDVSTITPGTLLCPSSLALADVLVIVAPQVDYSAFELDTINSWVKSGGRLLLISEVQDYGSWASAIAERFNVTLQGGRIANYDKNVGIPPWPYYNGSNIRPHLITAGVGRIEMYAGDGIVSLSEGETALIVTDSDGSAQWMDHTYALNVSVMSAFDGGVVDHGRMVVSTDSNLWDSAYDLDSDGALDFWDSDNHVLALNIIDWLSARREHELAVSLDAPSYVGPRSKLVIEIAVFNKGLNNETNVMLQLLIDGSVVQNETVGFLASGTHRVFVYSCYPSVEATFNVTAYAPPLQGEDLLSSNICSRTIRVRYTPRILAYVEYADCAREYYNTLKAINSTFGSNYNLTELWDYTQLDSILPNKDILLIPEQEHANMSNMRSIVSAWSRTLSEFLESGGIVIVCDYSGGTYHVLADTGFLSILGVENQTGKTLFLNDAQDPLAKKVSPSFVAPNGTVTFFLQEARTFVSNGTSAVVIHRELGQGHVVLLGFDFYEYNTDTEQILGNAVTLATPSPDLESQGQGFSQPYIR